MTAEEITRIRNSLGLTQTELAKQLECRQATVSDWENGKKKISKPYIKLLSLLTAR